MKFLKSILALAALSIAGYALAQSVPIKVPGFTLQVPVVIVGAACTPSTDGTTIQVTCTPSSSSGSSTSSSTSSSGSSTSSSTSSSGSTTSSSSSGATITQRQQLLNYIVGLQGQPKHILVGQHGSYWSANAMDYEQLVLQQTGKEPAIEGFGVGDPTLDKTWFVDAQAWLAKGGVPLLSMWAVNPINGAGAQSAQADISQLLPGGSANAKWNAYIDSLAGQIKQLNGPAFFRPFLEMNGNWFWWGAAPPATFVKLWQYTYNRMVNTNGVTNLLWVYSPNNGQGNYIADYPGDGFVDISGLDSYAPSSFDLQAWTAMAPIKKPQLYAETGVLGANNDAVKPWSASNYTGVWQTVKTINPNVFAIVYFCQNWGLPEQNDDVKVMADAAALTLSDVPRFH